MAFTPTNFLEAERSMDQISQEATQHSQLVQNAISSLEQAAQRLTDMEANWGNAVAFIDNQAAANPTDEQWQNLKARKDKMVTDFISMRDQAIAVRDAAKNA